MPKRIIQIVQVCLLCFCYQITVFGAKYICLTCRTPIVQFQNFGLNSVTAVFIGSRDTDFERYEFELVRADDIPTNIPNLDNSNQNRINITDLQSQTAYHLYLKAICTSGVSPWQGPFSFNTNIPASSNCMIDLMIDDDNCPRQNEFRIEPSFTQDSLLLGGSIYLKNIDLIISHNWPPDLVIQLSNPKGNSIRLIENEGINRRNLGRVDNDSCAQPIRFSDNACRAVIKTEDDLIGSFSPVDPISQLNDGSFANGIWTLEICDQSLADIGALQYINLEFDSNLCQNPSDLFFRKITDVSAIINWIKPVGTSDSLTIEIESVLSGTITTQTIAGNLDEYLITELIPDVDYLLSIKNDCALDYSCTYSFRTQCAAPSMVQDFDDLSRSSDICGSLDTRSSVWQNQNNNIQNWRIWNAKTPTNFTGPSSDVSRNGQYIYIENSSNTCNYQEAVLMSTCLDFLDHLTDCDFQFAFHAYGSGIGRLSLEINSFSGDQTWQTIWTIDGDQGDQWIHQSIDLSEYSNQTGYMRFVYSGAMGNLADIALDDFIWFGAQNLDDGNVFYRDEDADGYGTKNDSLVLCTNTTPIGYVSNSLDCNDEDENINPSILESPCNLIDDNCNNLVDENQIMENLTIDSFVVVNETCLGKEDGSIQLYLTADSSVFTINWSNGATGKIISGLSTGFYEANIVDSNNCQGLLERFEISSQSELSIDQINITNASCDNESKGSVSLEISGGQYPYAYTWSDGQTDSIASGLSIGQYGVIITDDHGCQTHTDSILVLPSSEISADLLFIAHNDCYKGAHGQLAIAPSGGVLPYRYSWSNGDSTASLQNLTAGVYELTMFDANNCMTMASFEIFEKDALQITLTENDPINCFGESNGRLHIEVTGGTQPYHYIWSNGETSQNITGLKAGIYSVIVSDKFGCRESIEHIELVEQSALEMTVDSISPSSCSLSDDGSVQVQISGGTTEYQYYWSTENGTESNVLNNVPSGIYGLTVIDKFGCKLNNANLVVGNQNVPLAAYITSINQNLCPRDSIAIIQGLLESAKTPIEFNWSNGTRHIVDDLRDTISALGSGTYNYTITDAQGCVGISENIVIDSIADFQISFDYDEPIQCHGLMLDSLTSMVSGGTQPYSYLWSTNETDAVLYDVAAGSYLLRISDHNNCNVVADSLHLLQPDQLSVSVEVTNASGDLMNGEIEINIIGGTPDYVVRWADPIANQVGPFVDHLSSGFYGAMIEDINGCILDTTIFVDQSNSISNTPFKQEWSVYPNPNRSNIFNLSGDQIQFNDSRLHIEMYGLLGQKVMIKTELVQDGQWQITAPDHLKNGVYQILIRTKQSLESIPVIVVK